MTDTITPHDIEQRVRATAEGLLDEYGSLEDAQEAVAQTVGCLDWATYYGKARDFYDALSGDDQYAAFDAMKDAGFFANSMDELYTHLAYSALDIKVNDALIAIHEKRGTDS